MRTEIKCPGVYYYSYELPLELIRSVNNIIDINDVEFKNIDKKNVEAIAFNEDSYDIDSHHIDLRTIFINPMIFEKTDFRPLNPNKEGLYVETKLTTPNRVLLYRTTGKEYHIPSIRERFEGYKTHSNEFHRAFFSYCKGDDKTLHEDSRVIPIYSENQDYKAIMQYINENKEAKK